MSIELSLQRRQGGFELDVAFTVPGRGTTALFGASGAGKSSVLRCLAGLDRARGRIAINGEVWQQEKPRRFVATHRRKLGYVSQDPGLFAHLSVRENLYYGLSRTPADEQRVGFDEAVALLGVEPLLERDPAHLSGGEKQRVAIARALLTSPKLLLMDEPLAALDERSKFEIIPYLERMHDELAVPMVLVSHSLREVARLADHIVWLERGRVRDSGHVSEMLGRVAMVQAEEDVGAVVDTIVAIHDPAFHLTALDTRCGRLWVQRINATPGQRVRVRLPARDMSLSLEPEAKSSILNVWRARVEEITPTTPGQVLVRLSGGEQGEVQLLARITAKSADNLRLAPGSEVYARIKSVALME